MNAWENGNESKNKRDIVRLVNLRLEDVEFVTGAKGRYGYDLVIRIKETGETLTIVEAISNTTGFNQYGIQAIEFGDGSVMEWSALEMSQLLQSFGTDGNDSLLASRLNTIMHGGAGDDYLFGGAGNDTLYGGDGGDVLGGRDGNDLVYGEAGDDELSGGVGNDTLHGGAGDDYLDGESGDDILYGDDGADYLSGREGDDKLYGGAGADNLIADDGDDYLDGGDDNDYLEAGDGDDIIHGGAGDDQLNGGDGDDKLYGGDGDDYLYDGDGNDLMVGGRGNDVFACSRGGHDIIDAYDPNAGKWDVLDLQWFGYSETASFHISLNLETGLYDLVIINPVYGATVRVLSAVSPDGASFNPYGFQAIDFGDGLVKTWAEIYDPTWFDDLRGRGEILTAKSSGGQLSGTERADIIYGSNGNDHLQGHGGDDLIFSGEGTDILDGGAGNDTLRIYGLFMPDTTVVFDRGYGHDVVERTVISRHTPSTLTVSLANLTSEEVSYSFFDAGDWYVDLIITIRDTGETLTLAKSLNSLGRDIPYGAQSLYFKGIQFADGYQNLNDIFVHNGWVQDIEGTAGDDQLSSWYRHGRAVIRCGDGHDRAYGGCGNDELYGDNGNDELYGDDGNDIIEGGAGDDTLRGDAGDDYLDGGAGNDTLYGGLGNDIFIFGRGYGNDTAYADDSGAGKRDVIRLVGVNLDEVEFQTAYSPVPGFTRFHNLIIKILDTGETLTVYQAISTSPSNKHRVEAIEFGDGTVIELAELEASERFKIYGTEDADSLLASKLSQEMYGYGGDDHLQGDIGNDWLYGGSGDDYLSGYYGHDLLYGEDGDDRLFGDGGDDILDGGAGNDYLYGCAGDDVFIFGRGRGHDTVAESDDTAGRRDVVRLEGLTLNEVEFFMLPKVFDFFDLVIRIKDTGETLTVRDAIYSSATYRCIQAVEFGDGTVMEWAELEASGRILALGTEAAETLSASHIDTKMYGFGGNDTLHGGSGDDTIYGGTGNDTLNGNAGNDFLDGDSGDDILSGNDGDDHLSGGTGNDTLNGNAGNDTLDGGAGDDKLYGGLGNDVFIFGRGYGNDIVYAEDSGTGKRDVIRLIGLGPDEVEFQTIKSYSTSGTVRHDLVIRILDTGETVTIYQAISTASINPYRIEIIEFGDGTVIKLAELETSGRFKAYGTEGVDTLDASKTAHEMYGYGGNDTLNGNAGNDLLYGGAGNDTLNGNAGQDQLYGENGDDKLYGGADNDLLDGGNGNDYLDGGAGDDIFVFGRGRGHDTVCASDATAGKRDIVRLTGLSPEEVEFSQVTRTINYTVYQDLVIRIRETGETITVERGLGADKTWWVQAVEFAGGAVLMMDEILAQGLSSGDGDDNLTLSVAGTLRGGGGNDTLAGSSYDDILYGDTGADKLYGNAGNDRLYGGGDADILDGGAGDDLLEGGTGNDTLTGGLGNDIFIFGRGYGHDTVNANDSTAGKRDVVRLLGLTQSEVEFLTVKNSSYFDLVIRIKDTGETLTITNAIYSSASNSYSIQAVEFSDGTVMEWAELEASGLIQALGTEAADTLYASRIGTSMYGFGGADTLNGGAGDDLLYGGAGGDTLNGNAGQDALYGEDGDDTLNGGDGHDTLYGGAGVDKLYGNAGNDILDGGAGNDTLEGGAGDDIYMFGKGYGHDIVNNYDSTTGRRDIIRLAGLNPEDVEFGLVYRSGNYDLVIRIKETGETMTVQAGAQSNQYYWLQAVEFGDGTVWERDEIFRRGLHGTAGDDTLTLYTSGALYGESGNDTLNGSAGNDVLYGGAGADKLYGNAGNDLLDGGAGNDILEGGTGNDVYVFGKGYGHDTINAYDNTAGRRDIIRLAGLNPEDVEFSIVYQSGGQDLVIRIKETGETMTVQVGAQSNQSYWLQAVEFGDGTVWERDEIFRNGLHGSAGDDTLTLYTPGTLYGGAGNDTLNGSTGNDVLYGGEGDDKLNGNAGNDILDGGAGNDTLEGGTGDDVYVFGRGYGNDLVKAYDTTVGRRDVVRLAGLALDEVELVSKAISGQSNDLLIVIKATGETLTIERAFAPSLTSNPYGIQAIELGDGTVLEWSEIVSRGLIKATVQNGGTGNDHLIGTIGDDTLTGNAGNDILDGGAGNDTLNGGAGNDVYIFGRGYGRDTVDLYDSTTGKRDVLRLKDLNLSDVEFKVTVGSLNGYHHVVITVKATGETMTLQNAMHSQSFQRNYSLQAIEFADGTVMEWAALEASGLLKGVSEGTASNDTLTTAMGVDTVMYGLAGNDTLNGGSGHDVLDGGAGNDVLTGGTGNDVFVFGRGYGHDQVILTDGTSGKRDIVRLSGLNQNDVTFFKHAADGGALTDLLILVNDTNETLVVKNALSGLGGQSLEAIAFADGAVLDASAFNWGALATFGSLEVFGTEANDSITAPAPYLSARIDGRAGNDTLTGGDRNDVLLGGLGDDRLSGGKGDDVLEGGEGKDNLSGDVGNDILDGGAGNDTLEGGAGNDIYIFGRGYGHDTVNLYDSAAGKRDVVRLKDLNLADVEFKVTMGSMTGYHHVVITIKATGETLTLQNAMHSQSFQMSYSVQALEFAGGVVMEWSALEASGLLKGVSEGTASNDTVTAALGIDTVLYGLAGNDTLTGSTGNDTLDGGAGDDILVGGDGNDVYVFGQGYGRDRVSLAGNGSGKRDRVRLVGLTASDVTFFKKPLPGSTSQYDVYIQVKATGEVLILEKALGFGALSGIQSVEFGDGQVVAWEAIDWQSVGAFTGGTTVTGTAGNDSLTASGILDAALYGLAGNDTLTGGLGNDLLDGGAGNDTLNGGAGSDLYVFGRGYGNDTVNAYDNTAGRRDVIRLLGLGPDEVEFILGLGSDLVVRIKDSGETMTVQNGAQTNTYSQYWIQAVEFGDGTVWERDEIFQRGLHATAGNDNRSLYTPGTLYGDAGNDTLAGSDGNDRLFGGAGDDTLNGNAGNDILDGGAGNDTLNGGIGNDVFVFGRGYGNDTVNAYDSTAGRRDVIRLLGLGPDEVEFILGPSSDLVVRIKDTGETMTVLNGAQTNTYSQYWIQAVEFADGTMWERDEIFHRGLHATAGNDNRSLYTPGALYGDAGNDTLAGSEGNDRLFGGAGDDTLNGNAGNDILDGGAGNDMLNGGAGDDTYLFRIGDGKDTINNNGGGNDLLKFADVNPAELWFGKSSNHLIIGLVGTQDQVTVNNWYASGDYKIDSIQAGGSVIVESQVALMVQAMAAIGAPAGVGGQWTEQQRDALAPVLASYWRPAA